MYKLSGTFAETARLITMEFNLQNAARHALRTLALAGAMLSVGPVLAGSFVSLRQPSVLARSSGQSTIYVNAGANAHFGIVQAKTKQIGTSAP